MIVPPPRRSVNPSGRDDRTSGKAAPEKKEFRVSQTTLLWLKRGAVVVGVVAAILLTVALLGAFDSDTPIPKIDNPKLDAAVSGQ